MKGSEAISRVRQINRLKMFTQESGQLRPANHFLHALLHANTEEGTPSIARISLMQCSVATRKDPSRQVPKWWWQNEQCRKSSYCTSIMLAIDIRKSGISGSTIVRTCLWESKAYNSSISHIRFVEVLHSIVNFLIGMRFGWEGLLFSSEIAWQRERGRETWGCDKRRTRKLFGSIDKNAMGLSLCDKINEEKGRNKQHGWFCRKQVVTLHQ